MYCSGCGAKLTEDDRFCRSCGKAVSESTDEAAATEVKWPAVHGDTLVAPAPAPAAAVDAPVATDPAALPASSGRPRWLIPTLAGGAFVVVAVVALLIVVLSSSGSSKAPLSEQAAPIMAPVSSDLSTLSDDLGSTVGAADMSTIRSDATRLSSSASTAVANAQALKLKSTDKTARTQLVSALQATAAFGRSTAAAAKSPSAAGVSRMQSDAADARRTYAAVAQTAPGLSLPANREFLVSALASYVNRQQAAAKAKTARTSIGLAAARSYASRIDSLLQNSADTRGDLGRLVVGIQNGTLSAYEAKSQISAILNQRQDLQNSVSLVDAPSPFAHAQQLLRASLTAAIDDDTAIQGWIDAWATNDTYGMNSFWQQHLDATARASSAKAEFVQAYNTARDRVLHKGPSPTGTNY